MATTIRELRLHQLELELQNQELRRAEIQLAEARDRFRELFDQGPMGYLVLDAAGRIDEANPAAGTILGVAPERLVARSLAGFLCRSSADSLHVFLRDIASSTDSRSLIVERRDASPLRLEVRRLRSAIDGQVRVFAHISASELTPRLRSVPPPSPDCEIEAARRLGVGIARDCGDVLGGLAQVTNALLRALDPHDPDRECVQAMHDTAKKGLGLIEQLGDDDETAATGNFP